MSAPRTPRATEPARIGPLATLPLFHKLDGRRVVLAGDGDGALWKAELLAAAGGDLVVFAPGRPEAFASIAANPPAGHVTVVARAWRADDLVGARLAVVDAATDEEAARFVEAARAAGAVVNVIDRPEFCDVQFGALVDRSPLVVAISTDGAAPIFGQAVRAKIEAALPGGLRSWAKAAKAWRPFVQARGIAYAGRRAFWERFTAMALRAPERAPTERDRERLLSTLDWIEASPPQGRVTLVGAGPGDPDLLTMKAVRTLQAADVILYDDLVSDGVLDLARREAKRMLVGKTGHGPSCRQDDINATMIALARAGRHVVRLKSGDPMIFGRAAEEIDACAQAGVPVEVVPGVSAAQGAAASLKVSLTERGAARRVQFVTGHDSVGDLPADLSWAALTDPGATTVLYMPRRTLARFVEGACAAGLPADTPACAVAAATQPGQAHVATSLADLPYSAATLPADEPMLVIVGAVVRRAAAAGVGAGQVLLRDEKAEQKRFAERQ